jgi:hypothetical protein
MIKFLFIMIYVFESGHNFAPDFFVSPVFVCFYFARLLFALKTIDCLWEFGVAVVFLLRLLCMCVCSYLVPLNDNHKSLIMEIKVSHQDFSYTLYVLLAERMAMNNDGGVGNFGQRMDGKQKEK